MSFMLSVYCFKVECVCGVCLVYLRSVECVCVCVCVVYLSFMCVECVCCVSSSFMSSVF